MKKLLAILSVLTVGVTAGDFNILARCELPVKESKIIGNFKHAKTQQDTIYIDQNGNPKRTSFHDLWDIKSKEIIQIGFFQNDAGEIVVPRMPKTVEKVPNYLPPEITSLRGMFGGASSFNQNLSNWNTSNITDMFVMFYSASSFNQNLSNWNTSNVIHMGHMFWRATSFNGDITTWDTSKVIEMDNMFHDAVTFNQKISKWNTSNVTDMYAMFANAASFNQDLSKWIVDKVLGHNFFASGSGITNPNYLPKWKHFNLGK